MERKSEKIVKKVLSFFFKATTNSVLYVNFFFVLVKFNFARMFSAYMYHEKICVPAFF